MTATTAAEFLNHHLLRYLTDRRGPVAFTRSRPYHKNDNGHVEQKNWTHVRQLLGYDRLGEHALLEPLNRLYREIWEPRHNYFLPSAKLVAKTRHGAKLQRPHDRPQTPCERLLASPALGQKQKQQLRQTRAKLNPFTLQRALERQLRKIISPPLHSSRPRGGWHSGPGKVKPTKTHDHGVMNNL